MLICRGFVRRGSTVWDRMAEPRTEHLSTRVTAEEAREFRLSCHLAGVTVSQALRLLMREYSHPAHGSKGAPRA